MFLTRKDAVPTIPLTLRALRPVLYAIAEVPHDLKKARQVVGAFLDFYGWERGWQTLKGAAA